jgi:ribonuclease HI
MLFTDGSVDTKTQIGFGAYLAIENIAFDDLPLDELLIDSLKTKTKTKQFEHTSSTRLELQTLLWAIDDMVLLNEEKIIQLIIYTDSQNILDLPTRRSRLEQQHYHARNGKPLKNADIYQQFFKTIDHYDCQIIKVDGHKPRHEKNEVDKIFSLVDKASRSALRSWSLLA